MPHEGMPPEVAQALAVALKKRAIDRVCLAIEQASGGAVPAWSILPDTPLGEALVGLMDAETEARGILALTIVRSNPEDRN